MFSVSSLITLLAVASPLLVSAASHQQPPAHRRHHEVANRPRGDISKRYDGARATYYAVGLGACGIYNKPSDFIVALNSAQYGGGYPGPHCFETITIHCGGKTTTATITDECPGCPFAGLDMSEGLFQFCGPLSAGVLSVSWTYNDGNDAPPPPPKTTSKPVHTEPTTTWHPDPTTSTKPTSTWHPDPTTSTTPRPTTTSKEPETTSTPVPTTSTSTSVATSTTQIVTAPATTSSTSTAQAPSTSATTSSGGASGEVEGTNLESFNALVLGFGGLIGSAAQN